MANVVAIILARGGSKGIPGKNIIDFCGKPLIVWTIEQLKQSRGINSIWVSSDSEEILSVSQTCGTEIIHRPTEISSDSATSDQDGFMPWSILKTKLAALTLLLRRKLLHPYENRLI